LSIKVRKNAGDASSNVGEHVFLLRRETVTDFVPAEQDGHPQPVLLIEHGGGPVHPAELVRLFENGEASIAVVNATVARPAPGTHHSERARTS